MLTLGKPLASSPKQLQAAKPKGSMYGKRKVGTCNANDEGETCCGSSGAGMENGVGEDWSGSTDTVWDMGAGLWKK